MLKKKNTNRINICSKDNEIIFQKKNQNYSNVPLYVPMNIDKISVNHNIINNQVLNDKFEHLQAKIIGKDKDSKQMNIKTNINDKHILKYKYIIEDIAKHVCYCCQKLCFQHQVCYAFQLYIKHFPNPIKNIRSNDHVLVCKSCRKKIDFGKHLNLSLHEHILSNKPNMEFVFKLNKIEERLIAPCFVFAPCFVIPSLYGQYGMHGSIINVPTNLILLQNVLPQMPYDDYSILV
jgi:hypothetical protein